MRVDNPTMLAATEGGAMIFPRVLVSSFNVEDSPATTIEITDLTQFDQYMIIIKNLRSDTDLRDIKLAVSSDNGATYIADASYLWGNLSQTTGAAITGTDEGGSPDTIASITRVSAFTQLGDQANEQYTYEIFIHNLGSADSYFTVSYFAACIGSGSLFNSVKGSVSLEQFTVGNAIRLSMNDTGNFSNGQVRVYGIPL